MTRNSPPAITRTAVTVLSNGRSAKFHSLPGLVLGPAHAVAGPRVLGAEEGETGCAQDHSRSGEDEGGDAGEQQQTADDGNRHLFHG
jgi:hypothetical protein